MTKPKPSLLPPLSTSTMFDYLLIVASIAIGVAVAYVRLLG
jgi:hypothetical protein